MLEHGERGLTRREAALRQELELHLRLMAERDRLGTPLRANEMMVEIWRDKYRELCGLALEALLDREKDAA